MADFHLTSQAFNESEAIPSKYTCEGKNVSPPLHWDEMPKQVRSFVLIVDDPDAPSKTWVHWVLYNISAETVECKEGTVPPGALQGINDFGNTSYGGPCPPSGTHRYFFKLYALDTLLTLPQGATKEQVENAMKGHVFAETQLIGTYKRQNS